MEITKKNDFIEIRFTGRTFGEIFDSNTEDIKKVDKESKVPEKGAIIAIGQGMVVKGLDISLENKEIGKSYDVVVSKMDGFGERRKELVKTIPLKVFTERRIMPQAGMILNLDDMLVKVSAVSGARVIVDFNNPLAGKELNYHVTIVRKVEDEKEKVEALFKYMFKFVPEFEIADKIKVKGPKIIEAYVKSFSEKFKELVGKELEFIEIKNEKKEENNKEKVEVKAEQ